MVSNVVSTILGDIADFFSVFFIGLWWTVDKKYRGISEKVLWGDAVMPLWISGFMDRVCYPLVI